MFRAIENYEVQSIGLPYPVIALNGVEEELDEQGNRIGVSIPDLEGFVAAVAVARALDPMRLSGPEVRFMRRVLDKTARTFAEALEIRHETLSRWEKEHAEPGAWADKQVRMAVIIALKDRVPGLRADTKAVVEMKLHPRIPDEEARIVMQRVPCARCPDNGGEAWDMKLAA